MRDLAFIFIQIKLMSAEELKQLKIKTGVLKRLRKEYESYVKEETAIQNKINKYQQDIAITKDEETDYELKKHREFLLESETVLSNVKQKFIEAFEGLVQFLSEKGEVEGINHSEEKNMAENLVLDNLS